MKTSVDVGEDQHLETVCGAERLRISAWGPNALRVQATISSKFHNPESALTEGITYQDVQTTRDDDKKTSQIINGNLQADLGPSGKITFTNRSTGKVVLQEFSRDLSDLSHHDSSALRIPSRDYKPILGTDSSHITARFESLDPNERIYGMGQYQQPFLNLKGADVELAQRNSQASIPFAVSSLGVGILWNNAGVGRAVFGKNATVFEAYSSQILDYWVVVGVTPKDIVRAYTAVTGRPPMMPEYGLGLWQSKLRYQTQEETLEIAHEYKRRKLPLDVLVIDFFHWPKQGEWKFDKDFWPDPKGMIKEIQNMGIKVVVSVWPTVEPEAETFKEMQVKGLLVRQDRGFPMGLDFPDNSMTLFFDPFNPATREYVWQRVKRNYWDLGVRSFWLDVAEPEYRTYEFDNHRYLTGACLEIGNAYPKYYSKAFYDGMSSELSDKAEGNIVNLVRCAWVGSVKYGALLWSGDVASSWHSMRAQFAAGLNAGVAGQSWWTVDIGGFHGANVNNPEFRELFVRWYQWGTFLPVMRVHGDRLPKMPRHGTTGGSYCLSGSPNEIWSYGEEVYDICKMYLMLRQKLREYTRGLMKQAHEHGDPVIRQLFYEFPEDEKAWTIEDQFMFGDKYLVAPIFEPGLRTRKVYLPSGSIWRAVSAELGEGKREEGGQVIEVKCPLGYTPVFARQ